MKVIKHGRKYEEPIRTTCESCGCKFEHGKYEGKYSHTQNYEYSAVPTEDVYTIECPECKNAVFYAVRVCL